MVILTARVRALPDKEEEAAQQFAELAAAVQEFEEGTLIYVCHASLEAPGEFLFYEVYADEHAHQMHTESAHFNKFRKLMGTVLDAEFGVQLEKLAQVGGFSR